ncbi:hypothetical protein MIR68_009946 [Amoeboaphelidium protococcarum]|nr:hypothetical protein MIR68_009946 [Amoeboaphelidium protococcarum]
MSALHKQNLKETVRQMFYHAFNGYMKYAFPLDELDPILCQGKTRDYTNPHKYYENDVLGDFSLTLIDSLDMLILLKDFAGFRAAVDLVKIHVSFDSPNIVQVFETNIRVVGGLLSAHVLASDMRLCAECRSWYDDSLLRMAYDVAERLLPAFNTTTGIPYARVSLNGKGKNLLHSNITCSAAAGTLLLEFGTLSRLTGDQRFENVAKKSLLEIWRRRSHLHLIGNEINVSYGVWTEVDSHFGAGIDSFFEYALKSYVLFGDDEYLQVFNTSYNALNRHLRVNQANRYLYLPVQMFSGDNVATWIDSLAAFFPGLQVLAGDLPSAVRLHEVYCALWRRFHGMPERYDAARKQVISVNYPLRPEFIESTYFLYLATRDEYYLRVGQRIVEDLQQFTRTQCGFATVDDLLTKKLGNRMESFFLSETLKYLYLLFDEDHILNKLDGSFVFTTEAHVMAIKKSKGESRLQQNAFAANVTCPVYKRSTTLLDRHPLSKQERRHIKNLLFNKNYRTGDPSFPTQCEHSGHGDILYKARI